MPSVSVMEGFTRRVRPHSFTEISYAGCNPSVVETSDGCVMIDTPQQPIDVIRWREMLEEKKSAADGNRPLMPVSPIASTCRRR